MTSYLKMILARLIWGWWKMRTRRIVIVRMKSMTWIRNSIRYWGSTISRVRNRSTIISIVLLVIWFLKKIKIRTKK